MTLLHVTAVGGLALIEDLGRTHPEWGVSRSGAADRGSLRLANRLVGNSADAAGIEVLLGGLGLRAEGAAIVAVTGASCPVTVDGRPVDANRAIALADGSTIHLGTATSGLRAYIAVRGGLDGEPVLGSRSRDVLGQLGPAPLTPGCVLQAGHSAEGPAWFEHVAPRETPALARVSAGPRGDWFDDAAHDLLASQPWTIRPESDRTGLRLSGVPLVRRSGDLPSEPTVVGAVQVPPDGQPIILGPDSGVSGGYPVIAVVHDADLDLLAQLRPGDTLHLRWA